MPLAGERIKALDFTAAQMTQETTGQVNVGTSFAAGSPECGTTFVAPTSGKVKVTVGGIGRDDGSAHGMELLWEIYEGTSSAGSAVITVASLNYERNLILMQANSWTALQAGERSYHQSGLTAGTTYYARTMHRATGGSSVDILVRSLMVEPLAA